MSEPKYWLVGKVSVPEEEKAELNSAVLEVLKQEKRILIFSITILKMIRGNLRVLT